MRAMQCRVRSAASHLLDALHVVHQSLVGPQYRLRLGCDRTVSEVELTLDRQLRHAQPVVV